MLNIINLQNMKASSHSNVGLSDLRVPLKYRDNIPTQSGPLKIESSQMFL